MGAITRSSLGLALAFAFAGQAQAANYATCLLDKLPGTMNDQTASAIRNICSDKYSNDAPQGSGRGMFSYKSGSECLAAKGKDTRSARSVQLMSWACNRLYDEPNFFDQFDPKR